jgi:alpha-glucan,water dikinase
MAVLIQEVIEAEYAFVLHTVNPFNRHRDELYAEAVLGLGETLVGNHPGRAFSVVAMKGKTQSSVLAYPSKSLGLFGGGLIFRSDSNAEDLAGYAGAGLYDSLLLQPPREVTLDYTNDPLVWDKAFRSRFVETLRRLGDTVEAALGAPQDIEGVYAKERYYVVQARPQVGLEANSENESRRAGPPNQEFERAQPGPAGAGALPHAP